MNGWRRRINKCLNTDGPTMVFQPIYTIEPHALVGYEALSRFPEGDPAEWYTEAVHVGLSYELEMAAMRSALDRLAELPPHTYLAVNVSPANVVTPGFMDELGAYDLGRVVLELTEHDPVESYDALRACLDPLRRGGSHVCTPVGPRARRRDDAAALRVSVDDLGAGFASMQHVIQLSPDFMKLDIDLVRGCDVSYAHRQLVRSIVGFGSAMGVRVVAEGVETEGELVTLRALDVHSVQGFLLGRPEPLPAKGTDVGPVVTAEAAEAQP